MTTELPRSPESGAGSAPAHAVVVQGNIDEEQVAGPTGRSTTFHGWVCSGPFFETVLFLYCTNPGAYPPGNSQVPIAFDVFDADGLLCNQLSIMASTSSVTGVEWDPFLGGCKFEAGMKHGHVIAQLPPGFSAVSRLIARESSCFIGSPAHLTTMARAFFPVLLSRDRFPILILINCSEVEATVRGRLFCGKRTPETVWSLPPRGVRILSVAHEFGDAISLEPEEQVQAYLRMGLRGEYEVLAQFVERMQGAKDSSVFLAIS